MEVEIITISSKGQISIPVKIRKELNWKQGDKLVAYTFGDSIIIKALSIPSHEEFLEILNEARKEAKEWALKEEDITAAISEVRKEHK